LPATSTYTDVSSTSYGSKYTEHNVVEQEGEVSQSMEGEVSQSMEEEGGTSSVHEEQAEGDHHITA
jgi:hypothetical protein